MTQIRDFEKLIKQDRDKQQEQSWSGNLIGYLDKVKTDPTITRLAHARMYEILLKAGIRNIHDNNDPRVKRLYKD